jgi:hypothetical protein
MALALRELMQRVADELDGDWLLVGGGIVALWLDATRVTEDVELVGVRGTQDERYALIDLCTRAGSGSRMTFSCFLRCEGLADDLELAGKRGEQVVALLARVRLRTQFDALT